MKRGDIFTVSVRGHAKKPRPGLIVHATGLIQPETPVLVCPLTSNLLAAATTRPTIEPTPRNGLRQRSQVMVNRMTSASLREIGAIIGTLTDDDIQRVDLALITVLELSRAFFATVADGEVE